MKNVLKILLPIIALFTLSHCNKYDKNENVPTTVGSITCKVDGKAWNSKVASGLNAFGIYLLSGTSSDGTIVGVSFQGTQIGTYDLISFASDDGTYLVPSTGKSYSTQIQTDKNVNKLIITQIDSVNQTISGTFQFYATEDSDDKDKVHITEGVINKIFYVK
ncbi:MAG: hypothetical protein IPQ02_14490 [Saprospiraceae bacterium]|nr:hypothetical protein [Candidatus Defluviibacterium haderslevense]